MHLQEIAAEHDVLENLVFRMLWFYSSDLPRSLLQGRGVVLKQAIAAAAGRRAISDESPPRRTAADHIAVWNQHRHDYNIPSPRTPMRGRLGLQPNSPATGTPQPASTRDTRSRTPRAGDRQQSATTSVTTIQEGAPPSLIDGCGHWQQNLLEHYDHIRRKRFHECSLSRRMLTTEVGVGMGSTEVVYKASIVSAFPHPCSSSSSSSSRSR